MLRRCHRFGLVWLVLIGLTVVHVCTYGQDQSTTRHVTGQQDAQGAQVIINQIETSAFPEVTIFATVLNEGLPLRGLVATDFRVREDEVDQEPLTVVPKLSPLSVVITLDTSGSMRKRLSEAQAAARGFVETLNPRDNVHVMGFAREVKVLYPLGNHHQRAKTAIAGTVARGDTALYDALYASVAALKDQSGRKAIVLLSDGVDDDGTGKQLTSAR
jgi:Mg-chelatase subunit ChlD